MIRITALWSTIMLGVASLALIASPSAAEPTASSWDTITQLDKARGQACVAGSGYPNVQLRHQAKKAKASSKSKSIYFAKPPGGAWNKLGATPWVKGGEAHDHDTAYVFTDGRPTFKITVKFKGGPKKSRSQRVREIERCE